MASKTGIMFVANSLRPGGTGQVLLNLVRGLMDEGRYAPAIACLGEKGPLAGDFESLGVDIHERLLKDKYDPSAVIRLARLIDRYRVKIVVCVGSGRDPTPWGVLAARVAGARVVVWSQTFSQPGYPAVSRAGRVLYPLVDRFIALGKRHKACLAWRDKAPEGRITIIPNAISPNGRGHAWRDRARAILGLADENILAIGMIGRLRPEKRHDVFIDAARQVIGQNRNVHFFIIGDGPARAEVRAAAEKSELLGRYLSLLGHRDDLPWLIPGLDLTCFCSDRRDCQSLAALEAMAAGVPVVSNVIGSMDEAIIDNQTGFFYHPSNPRALADRILEVASRPELRQTVGQAARRHIDQNFTADRLVRDFTRLFDHLLLTRHRPTGRLGFLRRTLSSRSE